ncbi:MAG: glycosyltransferase 87 family protein [Planctomycetota bacterium]
MRVLCLLVLLATLFSFARTAKYCVDRFAPDFEYFYKGGAALLQHGGLDPGYDVDPDGRITPRGGIEWYLPFVSRILTLLAWAPPKVAGLLWLGLNLLATLATMRLVGSYLVGLPRRDWPVTQLVPFILLAVFWYWEYRLNQINNFTLLLLTAAFVCWQRGKHYTAGFWLGLAVLLKVTPLLLVVWFLLKRQLRTVTAAVVTILVAGPLATFAIYGQEYATDCYRSWLHNATIHGSQRGLIMAQTEMDWRNQGLGAVASRWLHPTNYALHFDNDPRLEAPDEYQTMNVLSWSRETIVWLVLTIQVLSLIGLIWLARHPARKLSPWQLRLEWGLFLLAMLWFMPVMRGYHLIWAYPALAILAGVLHHVGWRRRWSWLALACLLGMIVVQCALRWTLPQAAGILLWSVLGMALPIALMLVQLKRDARAIPNDCINQ